jgi:ATPase subunit of ABC transporter with duplicated ATPase domains
MRIRNLLLTLMLFGFAVAHAQDDAMAASQRAAEEAMRESQRAMAESMAATQKASDDAMQSMQASMASLQADDSSSGNTAYHPTPTAAKPQFSLKPGKYSATQWVDITDSTRGATIYNTTDGSTPTASSTRYLGPVYVTQTTTLKAMAVARKHKSSKVASANYRLTVVPALAGASAPDALADPAPNPRP